MPSSAPGVLLIQPAVEAERDAIVALVNECYRGDASRAGWTSEADLIDGSRTDADEVLRLVRGPASVILVCRLDGELVGCVHLHALESAAYLGMLSVRPRLQNHGIGRRLLEQAERFVYGGWGLRRLCMAVITVRRELLAYYERRGYRRTGQRRPFPADSGCGSPRAALELELLEKRLDAVPDATGRTSAASPA